MGAPFKKMQRSHAIAFPRWVPPEILRDAGHLSMADAEQILSPWLPWMGKGTTKGRG
jgi:hypothetical protein